MKSRFELFTHFLDFHILKSRLSSISLSKFYKVTMVRSTWLILSSHFEDLMAFIIKHHTLILQLRRSSRKKERKNTHLLETTRALLFQLMKVLKHFLVNALSIVYFFINRMPSLVLNDQSPFHIICPEKPLFPKEPKIFLLCMFCEGWSPSCDQSWWNVYKVHLSWLFLW